MKRDNKLHRVNFHLTDSQHEELKDIANKTGITVASQIRIAINEYLKKHKEN